MLFESCFSRGSWRGEEYRAVYSPICKTAEPFYQEDNCIVNGLPLQDGKFPYTSLLTRRSFSRGATLRTHCSFEHYGAPLLVISNDVTCGEDGILRYGLHFEAVGYENGVNLWRIVRVGPDTVSNTNLVRWKFPVEAGRVLALSLTVREDGFVAALDGESRFVPAQGIPEHFSAGITACEGRNRFYDFSVEE